VLPIRLAASEPIRDGRCDAKLAVPAAVANFDKRLSAR